MNQPPSSAPAGPGRPTAPAGAQSAPVSAPSGSTPPSANVQAGNAASAGQPSVKPPVAGASGGGLPGGDQGEQAALLQSVVDKLRPEQGGAKPEPEAGYTPRVFAFEEPARSSGGGANGSDAARPASSSQNTQPAFMRPITGMIPKLKPLTGAIARVVHPNAAQRSGQGPATPAAAAVPQAAFPQAGVPQAAAPQAAVPAAAMPPASVPPASVPPAAGSPAVPPAGEPATVVPPSPAGMSPGVPPAAAPPFGSTQPIGTQPMGTQPMGTQPMGTQPMGTQPVGVSPFGAPRAGATPPPGSAPHGGGFPYSAPGPQSGPYGAGPGGPGQIQPPPNFPNPLGANPGGGAPKRVPVKALLAVGLGVVAVVALFAILAGVQAGAVPGGTTVAGVDIGGRSRDEAIAALDEGLAKQSKKPIEVVAGENRSKLDPRKSGLAYDAEATVDRLTGFSLDPVRMWQHLSGSGGEADLVLAVDDEKLSGAVDSLSENMAVKPADGGVEFTDGVPRATDSRKGSTLDAAGAKAVITENWLVAKPPYTLPAEQTEADISQGDVDAAMTEAQKVISASVEVQVEGQSVELTPADLATFASYVPDKSRLALRFDRDGLVELIVERTSGLLTIPEDAHFEFQGGKPVVVGGGAGTTLDAKEVGKAVNAAARGDDRVAQVKLHEQDPEDTKKALEELGVKEIVSEFSTPLTADTVRTQNLIRGAEMITGNLVKPGETFSLIEALSPITEANGYVSSGIVSEGKHVEGVGGGLSQMATTSYNAGYFAGYDDVEHRQHSFWFPRYPAGREATIYVGALDMKFTNDTPYGAVFESFVSNGQLTVRIWSTKHYTVETSDTGQQDVVRTSPVKSNDPECVAYPGGENGFSITNFRKVYLNGELVKDESYSWTYKPDNPVECTRPGGGGGGDGGGGDAGGDAGDGGGEN